MIVFHVLDHSYCKLCTNTNKYKKFYFKSSIYKTINISSNELFTDITSDLFKRGVEETIY